MTRRKPGQRQQQSLFASLPHELRQTIRINGLAQSVRVLPELPAARAVSSSTTRSGDGPALTSREQVSNGTSGGAALTEVGAVRNGNGGERRNGARDAREGEEARELVRTQPESVSGASSSSSISSSSSESSSSSSSSSASDSSSEFESSSEEEDAGEAETTTVKKALSTPAHVNGSSIPAQKPPAKTGIVRVSSSSAAPASSSDTYAPVSPRLTPATPASTGPPAWAGASSVSLSSRIIGPVRPAAPGAIAVATATSGVPPRTPSGAARAQLAHTPSAWSSAIKRVRTESAWTPSSGDIDIDAQSLEPARKKRKGKGKARQSVAAAGEGPYNAFLGHPWDCTGLVQRYSTYNEVPHDLRKYFNQRHLLFEEYDTMPLLMDHTGWFSVTAQPVARHIAERCRCDVIVDAFCGVGGNAIEFAKTCERVIAIDNDLTRLRLARHNALQYGVADRIEFIHGSYIDWARAYAASNAATREAVDVVFLSPPWGGPDYLTLSTDPLPFPPTPAANNGAREQQQPSYPLSAIEPIPGDDLFRLSASVTPNIAYYLPRNTSLSELAALAPLRTANGGAEDDAEGELEGAPNGREWVEVEEEWVGGKVKAITAYYGELVAG